jgi:hypothetical protein
MGLIIGGLILLVGIILFIGNVSGLFPSYPYAGFITMSLGSIIIKIAKDN